MEFSFGPATQEVLIERFLSRPYYLYLVEKLQQSGVTSEANSRISECLKLLLLIHNSKGTAPISKEIDEVWHLMILETREYAKLCSLLPSSQFIHHRSVVFDQIERGVPKGERPSREKLAQDLKEKLSWFISYRVQFGPFTESVLNYWPLTKEIMKDKNWSLNQFNDLLIKSAKVTAQ